MEAALEEVRRDPQVLEDHLLGGGTCTCSRSRVCLCRPDRRNLCRNVWIEVGSQRWLELH